MAFGPPDRTRPIAAGVAAIGEGGGSGLTCRADFGREPGTLRSGNAKYQMINCSLNWIAG